MSARTGGTTWPIVSGWRSNGHHRCHGPRDPV